MKKFIILNLMLCLGYAGMIKAANTDISTLDNIIYVEPFNAAAGTQVQMSIKMKNSAAIRGFQFDLFLPDGVTAAKSAKGKILASLTESRLPLEDEHTLTLSEQGDGSIRFLCGSLADETFTGTDGEIATLTINVDGGMANGDYPVYLRTMKLTETDISKFYETAELETTLTIGAAGYTILDETSTVVPTAAEGVNVKVKRTINAGNWSTICLPFAMTEEQVKTAFGNDVELGDFTGYDTTEEGDDITGITVNFDNATEIESNHPYIIKVSAPMTEFTVDGVDINPEDVPCVSFGFTTGKGSKAVYHPIDFNGTYVADFDFYNDAQSQALFLSENKFYYATENTKHMKAFRAYFDFDDVLSDVESSSSRIAMRFDSITDINKVSKKMSDTSGAIYDLQGRRVNKPIKGIFIKDGKKIVIEN